MTRGNFSFPELGLSYRPSRTPHSKGKEETVLVQHPLIIHRCLLRNVAISSAWQRKTGILFLCLLSIKSSKQLSFRLQCIISLLECMGRRQSMKQKSANHQSNKETLKLNGQFVHVLI